jgi:hypothetical protein
MGALHRVHKLRVERNFQERTFVVVASYALVDSKTRVLLPNRVAEDGRSEAGFDSRAFGPSADKWAVRGFISSLIIALPARLLSKDCCLARIKIMMPRICATHRQICQVKYFQPDSHYETEGG